MSLTFEKTPLLLGLSGGALIVSGVSGMNTMPTKSLQKLVGIPFFSLGWALVAMGFIKNDTRLEKYKYLLAGSSMGVYGSAVAARMMTDAGIKGNSVMAAKMVFLSAWIALGIFVGMKKHEDKSEQEVHDATTHILGLLPPMMVVASMGIINKIERPRNIAGGLGTPLFAAAWVLLTLVNSVKLESHNKEVGVAAVFKSQEDTLIACAISSINSLKKKHHDIIVDALAHGASQEEHMRLLGEKEDDVLQAMAEAEDRLKIVFDKEDVTEVGPVKVIKRN